MDKCDLTHSFCFSVEAAVWAWILVSMVARSGQQPWGHCRNSLSCKRPLVERLSTVWSSQTCVVGLLKNALREKGGWRCLLLFRLMCVKPLMPLLSTEKELAPTFKCIHTDCSVWDGTHGRVLQPKCRHNTSLLCHPDLTLGCEHTGHQSCRTFSIISNMATKPNNPFSPSWSVKSEIIMYLTTRCRIYTGNKEEKLKPACQWIGCGKSEGSSALLNSRGPQRGQCWGFFPLKLSLTEGSHAHTWCLPWLS